MRNIDLAKVLLDEDVFTDLIAASDVSERVKAATHAHLPIYEDVISMEVEYEVG